MGSCNSHLSKRPQSANQPDPDFCHDFKSVSAYKRPLCTSEGILATDILQWNWGPGECREWLVAFFALEFDADQATDLAIGFNGMGWDLYLCRKETLTKMFGEEPGAGLWKELLEMRTMKGAVPKGHFIHRGNLIERY